MKRIAVVTKNSYLGQKIRLALSDAENVEFVSAEEYPDICFWDTDSAGDAPDGAVTMSRDKECMLALPFSFESLLSYLSSEKTLISIDKSRRICTLRGERVKLTELEGALLSLLISAGGEFVSREKILSEIWGKDADAGIINVYIHYLREKLEDGEKIILSSRKCGYCIDRRFLGGSDDA